MGTRNIDKRKSVLCMFQHANNAIVCVLAYVCMCVCALIQKEKESVRYLRYRNAFSRERTFAEENAQVLNAIAARCRRRVFLRGNTDTCILHVINTQDWTLHRAP